MMLFEFKRAGDDVWNKEHTRITNHACVNVVECDVDSARNKANLSSDYQLFKTLPLSKDWS